MKLIQCIALAFLMSCGVASAQMSPEILKQTFTEVMHQAARDHKFAGAYAILKEKRDAAVADGVPIPEAYDAALTLTATISVQKFTEYARAYYGGGATDDVEGEDMVRAEKACEAALRLADEAGIEPPDVLLRIYSKIQKGHQELLFYEFIREVSPIES